MEKGIFTGNEIITQTDAWEGALRAVQSMKSELARIQYPTFKQILFTGCGSTYYLSIVAAALFQELTGLMCKAIPGGELLMKPGAFYSNNNNLLFAISRSGATSETVEAVREFKSNRGGKVITISNNSNCPLSQISDLEIYIQEGQEKSIAQTRAFSSMLVAATEIALLASDQLDLADEMQKLPAVGSKLIRDYQDCAKNLGENLEIDRFYFLGSGFNYGLACEASLKMKEMTISHSEPFHFLEFRHGPISMVNEKTMICGLLSDHAFDHEVKVLREASQLGASVFSLSEKNADVSFNSELPEQIRSVLYLPILQLMAYYRSLIKGYDPDKPKNLSAVVYI